MLCVSLLGSTISAPFLNTYGDCTHGAAFANPLYPPPFGTAVFEPGEGWRWLPALITADRLPVVSLRAESLLEKARVATAEKRVGLANGDMGSSSLGAMTPGEIASPTTPTNYRYFGSSTFIFSTCLGGFLSSTRSCGYLLVFSSCCLARC